MSQKLKPEWEAFLAAIEEFPHIRRAAKIANVHFSQHYRKIKAEPEYAARYAESHAIGIGHVRDIAIRRAVLGYKEPVIYKGEYQYEEAIELDPKTGKKRKVRRLVTVTKYPERLLMKVLSGEIPEVYNTERHEHTGPNGGPIEGKIQIEFVKPKKSDK